MPLGEEIPLERGHQTGVPPKKSFLRTVADKHRLAAYHKNHCWRPLPWYRRRWPWTPEKLPGLVSFSLFQAATHREWIFAEITGDRPRQPAYKMKLMLSRVSWALADISCKYWHLYFILELFVACLCALFYLWHGHQEDLVLVSPLTVTVSSHYTHF